MKMIELKTKLGLTVYINIDSIDAIYQQPGKNWGILLNNQVTYMIDENEFQKLINLIRGT